MSKFWITNKMNNDTAEIFLYGYIDPYDVSAGDFIKELRSLEKDYANINVRINSGGGSVFEGLAIYNAMQQSSANIETWVDGLAASMASIIALAGKKCHMSKSAMIMTHKPSVGSYGNSDEHKKNAQLLDGLEQTMLSIYASRTGKTNADCQISFLNGKDNWFNADEAIVANLVDEIYDSPAIKAPKEKKDAKNVWSMYSQQQFAAVFNNQNHKTMDKVILSAAVMAALKLPESSDQSAVDSAITALIAKAGTADTLATELATAKTDKQTAESALATFKAETTQKEIDALISTATTETRITAEAGTALKTQFAGKPTELKALLATFQPYKSIVTGLDGTGKNVADLVAKDYEVLDKEGKLEALKSAAPAVFFEKFEGKHGKKHPEDPSK